MRLSRTERTWWSRWLIASLLFLQLATASYACALPSAPAGNTSMAGLPCAQAMLDSGGAMLDQDQPGLCHEHCKGGSQPIEPAAHATLAGPVMFALFVIPTPAGPAGEADGWQASRVERGSAPPPPHAILHCCFRI